MEPGLGFTHFLTQTDALEAASDNHQQGMQKLGSQAGWTNF